MNKFSLKTIVTTLIGTGIVGSLVALPVRASEDNLIEPTSNLILSQVSDGERNYTEPSDNYNFKNIIGLTGLAIGTGVVGYHLTRAYKLSLANSLPTVNNSSTSLLTRVSPKLRRELLRLVHNQQTADRLLSGTFNSHRDRSANWLAEKVIYDLKRDR
ncbi:hypothetical protein [Pleurocapsa sp. FMAR1]|uniref:hypothetical protein n=1 Tax=Pleurocapsa sp. FMAR1 TaxID=3040204 RepID=UPI0029C94038|nr:hypothetical protein [Pleurocapsa sp. FMAR1]